MEEDRIIRRRELEKLIGLTERQIRNLEEEDRFPKRFAISPGGHAIGWSATEVFQWIAARREAREASAQRPGQAA